MRPATRAVLLTVLLLPACVGESPRHDRVPSGYADTKPAPPAEAAGAKDEAVGVVADLRAVPRTGRDPLAYQPIRTSATAMIIRSGTASIEVDTLEAAIGRVRNLAARVDGYVASSDIQAVEGGIRSATIEIKVPAARFEELVNGLNPLGRLEQVNVSAQDVGEEFTDVTARVANGRRLEQRLIELIATRTGRLSDVLEIERELARVREEIDRMEGRLRYLEAHAAVSSLSVRIHEPAPLVGEEGSIAVLVEAFRQAWRNSVGLAASAIAAMGVLLPVALLGILGILGARKAWRRRMA